MTYAICPPLANFAMAHTVLQRSKYRLSQYRDPRGQILESFLTRPRYTIPRADLMVLLRFGSNGYSSSRSSRLHDFEYPMLGFSPANSRIHEISRSLPPVLLRWTAPSPLATSPLRALTSSRPLTPNFHPFHSRYPDM
jgi:hypothetical protein